MCLARVTGNTTDTNVGYKVFDKGEKYGLFKCPCTDTVLSLGVEKRDKGKAIIRIPENRARRWSEQAYKAGFHIFKNLSDAEKYAKKGQIICMVHFTCVGAVGFEGIRVGRHVQEAPMIVASRMTIVQVMGEKK